MSDLLPSNNTVQLPTEVIEQIICSIVEEPVDSVFEEDRESAGLCGSPERVALCACLQVSSQFYFMAHRLLFSKIMVSAKLDDPSYIANRVDLLSTLTESSDRLETSTRIRSIAKTAKILYISGIHSVSDALRTTKIIEPIAQANEGPAGGRLNTLWIAAPTSFYPNESWDTTDYPTATGPFWRGSLKLASSKSIRHLTLFRFPSIPCSTFVGCTYETMYLIECGFDYKRWKREVPWKTNVGSEVERGGAPIIEYFHWQNHARHFGGQERAALFTLPNQGTSNVQVIAFTIVPHAIHPNRGMEVVPESILSTYLPFETIGIHIQEEDYDMITRPHDIKLKPLSQESVVHFHKTPNVTLNVSRIERTGGVYVMLRALCLILKSLAGLRFDSDATELQHDAFPRQTVTSGIKCLTLIISPIIFWPLPRKHCEVVQRMGAEGHSRAEYTAFASGWHRLDSFLSAPIYQGVGKLTFVLEGDITGYIASMALDTPRALAVPKSVFWKFLPRVMSVRARERSVSICMGEHEFVII